MCQMFNINLARKMCSINQKSHFYWKNWEDYYKWFNVNSEMDLWFEQIELLEVWFQFDRDLFAC